MLCCEAEDAGKRRRCLVSSPFHCLEHSCMHGALQKEGL